MIDLYQFPFSHFCEKARWALDYKRIRYRTINLLPGLHVRAVRKLAPRSCVPVLVAGGTAIQHSSAIVSYADRSSPDLPLTPVDPVQAHEALQWESYLDEQIGVTLRLCYYHHALPDRKLSLRTMLEDAPWYAGPLFTLCYPRVRSEMQRNMNINEASAQQATTDFARAVDRLDGVLRERRFLVGDRFTRADLTACALLSPLCLPDDHDASMRFPPAFLAMRDRMKDRRFFRWVRDVYDNYRQPMPVDEAVRA